MKKAFLLIAILMFCVSPIWAEYTQTCKVKYKKQYDEWSDYYRVDVHFLTGSELNTKTKSFNYSSYDVYAVVFWSKDQATVMKLSGYMGCGSEVDENCINNKYSNLEGTDQEGRSWEICTKSNCY